MDTALHKMREDLPGFRSGSASESSADLDVPTEAVKCEVGRCYEEVAAVDKQALRAH